MARVTRMKQKEIEVILNQVLKEIQELKERVNMLERHFGYRSDTTEKVPFVRIGSLDTDQDKRKRK